MTLGHWELRRGLGDDDEAVNRKVRLAFEAGLAPILLVGEARDDARDDPSPLEVSLERQLGRVLERCKAEQVATAAFVYEPEGAIGVSAPASPEHVAAGCAGIGVRRGRERAGDLWRECVARTRARLAVRPRPG